jgi:hypothetical protein
MSKQPLNRQQAEIARYLAGKTIAELQTVCRNLGPEIRRGNSNERTHSMFTIAGTIVNNRQGKQLKRILSQQPRPTANK